MVKCLLVSFYFLTNYPLFYSFSQVSLGVNVVAEQECRPDVACKFIMLRIVHQGLNGLRYFSKIIFLIYKNRMNYFIEKKNIII
jgi:hypothetical protein